jgi:biopolymer transport protein ExbD
MIIAASQHKYPDVAEMISPAKRAKRGVRRSRKASTKVDLTPMVDVGFLLITFFVLTTTLQQPTAMKLTIPSNSNDSSETASGKTISLILAANNTVYYYNGDSVDEMHSTSYTPDGMRTVLMEKKKLVGARTGNAQETVVLVKPLEGASYGNVVNTLDELMITGITRYVLMEPRAEETAVCRKVADGKERFNDDP